MTLYYKTSTWSSQPQISEDQINFWKHIADKKNWRAEAAIDGSIEHYTKKLEFVKGPKVVKTFE